MSCFFTIVLSIYFMVALVLLQFVTQERKKVRHNYISSTEEIKQKYLSQAEEIKQLKNNLQELKQELKIN